MGKLRVLSGRQICQILTKNGFAEVRRRGSHVVMQLRAAETTVTVPVPDHHQVAIGTLLAIIRQSGVAREAIGVT
jgi:predicted RNA binding protein YcfA (HicA-like mRNA interferase family)